MKPNSMDSEYIPIKMRSIEISWGKRLMRWLVPNLLFITLKCNNKQGVVVCAFCPRTWKAEAGRFLYVWDQPVLCSEIQDIQG